MREVLRALATGSATFVVTLVVVNFPTIEQELSSFWPSARNSSDWLDPNSASSDEKLWKARLTLCSPDSASCIVDLSDQAQSDGSWPQFFEALSTLPPDRCHLAARRIAWRALESGLVPQEALEIVSSAPACNGGFFDGIFLWVAPSWSIETAVLACSNLDGSVAVQCAGSVGYALSRGVRLTESASGLCQSFHDTQLSAACMRRTTDIEPE